MQRNLSLGDLANLLLAWEAGEVSEGRLVELTGLDRQQLRELKQSAIEAGIALSRPQAPEPPYGLPAPSPAESTTDPES